MPLLFAGLQTLAFGDRFLLAVLAQPLSAALELGDAQMGLLQGAAFVLPFVAMTPVYGVLADRLARPWPVLAGLGLAAIAMAWSADAHSFAELLGARALLGVGEAAIAPAALARLAEGAAAGRAGFGVALFAAGGPVGKGLALVLGGALLGVGASLGGPAEAWRAVLGLAAAATLLAALAAGGPLLRPPGPRPAPGPPPGAAPSRATAVGPGGSGDLPALWAAAVAGVAAVLASQTTAAWAPSLFARSYGVTPAQAGVLTGAPLLVLSPGCGLAMGLLLDRASRRRRTPPVLAGLATCLAGVGAAALALSAHPGEVGALAAFGLLAGALGGAAVAGLRGVQAFSPARVRARVTAAFVAAANLIGFGVGPPLVGRLADVARARAGGAVALQAALTGVLEGAAALGLAAVVAASLTGSTRDRRRPEPSAKASATP